MLAWTKQINTEGNADTSGGHTVMQQATLINSDNRFPPNIDFNRCTVSIVHRIVLFWEPDCCYQDGGQENRREVGTYFITISSVY